MSFTVKVPNAKTLPALHQARSGEDLTEYAGLDELKIKFERPNKPMYEPESVP